MAFYKRYFANFPKMASWQPFISKTGSTITDLVYHTLRSEDVAPGRRLGRSAILDPSIQTLFWYFSPRIRANQVYSLWLEVSSHVALSFGGIGCFIAPAVWEKSAVKGSGATSSSEKRHTEFRLQCLSPSQWIVVQLKIYIYLLCLFVRQVADNVAFSHRL